VRIYYEDPAFRHIQVDRAALTAFLREHGVTDQDIQRLCIRFIDRMPQGYSPDLPAEQIAGSYNNSCSVYVCTKNRANKILALNHTLLHELRHYMKNGYQPGETEIPYWHRPSEIDARAFAEQHYKTQLLLYLVGVSDEEPPAATAVAPPTTFKHSESGSLLVIVAIVSLVFKCLWEYCS